MQQQTLAGRTIAVPESRELDVFAAMLERSGAAVARCPLVAILDAPDPTLTLAWIHLFNAGAMDDLILLTGEGLRRLMSCIEQHQPLLKIGFITRLTQVRKITRGPKPARVLRELGLKPDIAAKTPTTSGIIEALRTENLSGRTVGIQLYGVEPNRPLIDFLSGAGAAVSTVAPYIYANEASDGAVRELLTRMANGQIDAIAFTSTPQVERLYAVAGEHLFKAALARTQVAAIGPVVVAALARRNVQVQMTPRDAFFLKPLTNAMAEALGPMPDDRS